MSKEIPKLHFQEEIWTVPTGPPPPVDNFFTLHLTKNIIEHINDVEFDLGWVRHLSYFRFYE